jgi:ABC-type glycerol-3-phosphate transport system substrate-binding protein
VTHLSYDGSTVEGDLYVQCTKPYARSGQSAARRGLFISAVLVAGACTSPATSPAAAPNAAATTAQQKVTVSFLNWTSSDDTLKPWLTEVIDQFQTDNPGIEIKDEPVAVSDHLNQIVTRCSAGDCPDLAQSQQNDISVLAAAGLLEPLDNYDSAFISSLPVGTVNLARANGTLNGVPWSVAPVGFWFNKALMKQAGLDPAAPPTTLDETIKDIQVAKQKVPDVVGLGIDTTLRDIGVDAEWSFMHSFGAEPIKNGKPDADTPQMRTYLEWIRSLVKNDYTLPGKKFGEFRPLAAQGRQLFMQDGPYFKGLVQGLNKDLTDDAFYATWGVEAIPGGPANGPSAGASDHQTVMFKSSKSKDAAFKFMKYLASSEFAIKTYTVKLGTLPPVKGLEATIPQLNNPASKEFLNIANVVIVPPYGPKYADSVLPIMTNIQRAYSTEDSVADIAKDMQSQLEQVYGK